MAFGEAGTTSTPASSKKRASKTSSKKKSSARKSSTAKTSTGKSSTAKSTTAKSSTAKSGSKKGAAKQTASTTRRSTQQQPTPERYKEIQEALAQKGYLAGPADGTWGPTSVDALKRFQHDQNLTEDGKIGSVTLIALGLGPKREAAASPSPSQP